MFTISREICIDAAHRVPTHGSKCFNLHGHRYKIEAVLESAQTISKGEQTGMTMDFSFIKEVLMGMIHDNCDHALLWYVHDTLIQHMLGVHGSSILTSALGPLQSDQENSGANLGMIYQASMPTGEVIQTVALNFIPTAEELAKWWFHLIENDVYDRSEGNARLKEIRVHETPNSVAVYSPDQ